MEDCVLSFLKAEWKVNDTGSAHWASSLISNKLQINRYIAWTWLFSSKHLYKWSTIILLRVLTLRFLVHKKMFMLLWTKTYYIVELDYYIDGGEINLTFDIIVHLFKSQINMKFQ